MNKFSLLILGFLSLVVINAQEAAVTAPPTKEETQSTTSHKRLRELTLLELDKKNQRAREAGEIAAKFKSISAIDNHELRITEYLRLQKRMARLQDAIQKANERQADIAEQLRAAVLDTKLSLQESERLQECRQYIDEFARAQRLMSMQLKKLNGNIQAAILKLPPPPNFTTRSGLKMVLVGTAPNAFYVSETCIPSDLFDSVRTAKALQREPVVAGHYMGDNATASYQQAVAFCKWMSAYEFNTYQIPELKQLKLLPTFNVLPAKAVWSITAWSPDDINYSRAVERFGVKFQTVWDPKHLLSELDFIGELPNATYKNLGFIVTTSIRTGIRQRLETLMKRVNDEAQDQDTQKTE
ncbi:MAG: hypothetical protein K5787_17130 [Lentisphaeria bacterium]|nr:hypothetical protein [Lentisphaeria bacterium]